MNFDGRIAEVELASTALCGAKRSSSAKIALLHLELLGRVLLDVIGAGERRRERLPARRRSEQQLRRLAPPSRSFAARSGSDRRDEVDRPLRRVGVLVPERDVVAGAREGDRPGAADEAATDDRDAAPFPSLPYKRFDIAVDADRLARRCCARHPTAGRRPWRRHRAG